MQFWRHKGSGHSVIFISWVRKDKKPTGTILGFRYWSSQKSTRGIGYREELFGAEKGVDRKQVYLTRAGVAESAPAKKPAENGVGRDDRGDLAKQPASEDVALGS